MTSNTLRGRPIPGPNYWVKEFSVTEGGEIWVLSPTKRLRVRILQDDTLVVVFPDPVAEEVARWVIADRERIRLLVREG